MRLLFERHNYGQRDLDDAGRIQDIVTNGSRSYRVLAYDEDVRNMSKIKYRNGLRDAIYELVDDLAAN